MPAWADIFAAASCAALLCSLAGAGQAQTSDLVSKTAFRVCADPANLPLSDDQGEGYENRLAELFARELGLPVDYTWYPMATGFIRNTLRANRCDVVMGYAQGDEMVLNTNHYLTSSYVLVVPREGPLAGVETLSDPALQGRRIGIVAGSPPATHLARAGLIGIARSYPLMVDRRHDSPAEDMLSDLASGETAAAILWGPIGGPLVKAGYPGLKAVPLIHEELPPRMVYRITMGVRPGDKVWQRKLNSLIRRHRGEIDAILREAGVPRLNDMGTAVLDAGQ
ncbi:amino acid ABC transporter substrate-binding protein [Rhodovulum sulfidophilum]|uniref:Substrate-binding domain-containing protein n=1 Tax=Rhodovulum visakhapatnamense TaxID=364297 RepID=A0ABS1RDY9_9RHOB|nr:substrate-binding domain-containing protein [Rhodovulum visakhapatnamense]MBL3569639.1 substrate-binding domain-containing protein [Rhodovulum visakhapatnamense]MBL3577871.1 substrate-binding domain-containing protein [Rhodovulum visakhapatnamense]OLS43677.1 amino acid ABC transporter substrate-binding protein [Rhodovulum sulfidophilum]